MIRHHLVPDHVITDRVTGGGFIAYWPDQPTKFGHGFTRFEAIAELWSKTKPQLAVIEGEKV